MIKLIKCIDEVFTDEPTKIPKYDFVEGRRVGYITIDPDENDLFILDPLAVRLLTHICRNEIKWFYPITGHCSVREITIDSA